MEAFLIPFLSVFLSEFGDKSQLSILLLASRTKKQLHLLAGVMLGFLLVDGIAILAGSWITSVLPVQLIKTVAAILFIGFGILSFREQKEEHESHTRTENILLSGFLMVGLSEWGDKTQLASALFAASYNPVLVFLGVMLALSIVSLLAIFAGKLLLQKVKRQTIARIAGVIFIVLGVSFFLF
jgi:Ca2+/H+ antiporter, TMEM165/GDT1 family